MKRSGCARLDRLQHIDEDASPDCGEYRGSMMQADRQRSKPTGRNNARAAGLWRRGASVGMALNLLAFGGTEAQSKLMTRVALNHVAMQAPGGCMAMPAQSEPCRSPIANRSLLSEQDREHWIWQRVACCEPEADIAVRGCSPWRNATPPDARKGVSRR